MYTLDLYPPLICTLCLLLYHPYPTGISPGGNLGFENAAFKLTADMIALMDGPESSLFASFVDLVIRGYLVARCMHRPIIDLVRSMAGAGDPPGPHY